MHTHTHAREPSECPLHLQILLRCAKSLERGDVDEAIRLCDLTLPQHPPTQSDQQHCQQDTDIENSDGGNRGKQATMPQVGAAADDDDTDAADDDARLRLMRGEVARP